MEIPEKYFINLYKILAIEYHNREEEEINENSKTN